jgi:hypothetical protein
MRAAKKRRLSMRTRRLLVLAACTPLLVLGLWGAIHRVPWLGPLLADTARVFVGTGPIAKLEDVAYGLQDDWNRLWRADEAPQAYWEVPPQVASPVVTASAASPSVAPALPPFRLDDVPPVHKSWSAPGDGQWVAVTDARHPAEPPRMLKTLLHPDRNRSWTAVTVVAVDLRRVKLHLAAGKYEPKASEPEGHEYKRTGLIPEAAQTNLLAAFNGGFKFEHGRYGMRIDGVTLVKPRKKVCTILMHEDDRVEIGSWERFEGVHGKAKWWRQTPHCMCEDGKLHTWLTDENPHWGATVDGDTTIRRSAMGVGQRGNVLYVGIGDFTTAKAMALAMRHAGADDVAQLDVNWSFPKFVTFAPRADGTLIASAICKGFEMTEDDFLRDPYARDFFYLTRRTDLDEPDSSP